MSNSFKYFVEGPCEKALIKAFMFTDGKHFKHGKVEVFNFINERLSKAKARTINKDNVVAIVFDTDVENIEILEENINVLKKVSLLTDEHIILVPSVKTFEDEIVYSCNKISSINQLFNTKSVKEFKTKFIKHTEIVAKLEQSEFMLEKIWSRKPTGIFSKYQNDGPKIKQ